MRPEAEARRCARAEAGWRKSWRSSSGGPFVEQGSQRGADPAEDVLEWIAPADDFGAERVERQRQAPFALGFGQALSRRGDEQS